MLHFMDDIKAETYGSTPKNTLHLLYKVYLKIKKIGEK